MKGKTFKEKYKQIITEHVYLGGKAVTIHVHKCKNTPLFKMYMEYGRLGWKAKVELAKSRMEEVYFEIGEPKIFYSFYHWLEKTYPDEVWLIKKSEKKTTRKHDPYIFRQTIEGVLFTITNKSNHPDTIFRLEKIYEKYQIWKEQ